MSEYAANHYTCDKCTAILRFPDGISIDAGKGYEKSTVDEVGGIFNKGWERINKSNDNFVRVNIDSKGIIMKTQDITEKRILMRFTINTYANIRNTIPCSKCGAVNYDAVNWEDAACNKCSADEICIDCGSINNFNKLGACMSDECRARRDN